MIKADCPSCGTKIQLILKPKMGQKVVCKHCNADLEVVWLEPLELDFPFESDEDDDGDEDDDEDERAR
jgi:lysine biosynthesis protein LysW